MAVKKKATSNAGGAAASTEAAPKKAAPKKASKAPAVASGTTPKAGTPKAAPKAAAKKSAAPVKLSTSQSELLRKVGSAAEPGYRVEKKAEQRTLDALHERKLIKRGSKDKASGSYHYQISNAGKKHIGSSNPTP